MRKKEKEITEKTAIEAVIRKSLVCRLGLSDGNTPYIVPVCFGYRDCTIYVHGSLKGKKIDILKNNPKVCFEFDIIAQIVEAENACNWDIKYQSVIGYGRASFIEGLDEKRKALDAIMNQYSDKPFQFPENVLNRTSVIKIEIASMTGKQSGF